MFKERKGVHSLKRECREERDRWLTVAQSAMESDPKEASRAKGHVDVLGKVLWDPPQTRRAYGVFFAGLSVDDDAYQQGCSEAVDWYGAARRRHGLW